MGENRVLDTRGLKCPLPVLKARKVLKSMDKGEILHVQADDPVAVVDFPHFCTEQGHILQNHETDAAGFDIYVIEKQ